MTLKTLFLVKIRLTYYFVAFLILFGLIVLFTDAIEFQDSALMIFSVNSFLYGFYISPIISSQRNRVDDLHRFVRAESSKLYEIALYSKKLEGKWHHKVLDALKAYTDAAYTDRDEQGEIEYEKLMQLLISYDGHQNGTYVEMMRASFFVQEKRSEINRLLVKKVYKNEWIIMLMLFSVTLVFILLIKLPDLAILQLVPPIVSAGLSMLIIILAKMSALTHKRARSIWDPLNNLSQSHFYKINSK